VFKIPFSRRLLCSVLMSVKDAARCGIVQRMESSIYRARTQLESVAVLSAAERFPRLNVLVRHIHVEVDRIAGEMHRLNEMITDQARARSDEISYSSQQLRKQLTAVDNKRGHQDTDLYDAEDADLHGVRTSIQRSRPLLHDLDMVTESKAELDTEDRDRSITASMLAIQAIIRVIIIFGIYC
jgi:hypothetical protein